MAANVSSILGILNTHFNNTNVGHMTDKSDQFGFGEHQNKIISESRIAIAKFDKYINLIDVWISNRANVDITNRNVLRDTLAPILDGFKAILTDVDVNNAKNDYDLLSDIENIIAPSLRAGGFRNTIRRYSIATPTPILNCISLKLVKLCKDYIAFKKSKQLSFIKKHKENFKTLKENIPKTGKGILSLKLLGGLGVNLLAKSAAAFFKSPNLEKYIKYPADAYLASVGYDVLKQRNARLHLKQNIENLKSSFDAQKESAKITTLAGGTKHNWLKSKKNNSHVIVGEGPTKKEHYAINTGSNIIKGIASGPTQLNLNKGQSIWADGSGGTSHIDNDLSTLAGGTDVAEQQNPIVLALNLQYALMKSMFDEDKKFHKQKPSVILPQDKKNVNNTIISAVSRHSEGENGGGIVNSMISGATSGVAQKLITSTLPLLIGMLPEILIAAVAVGTVAFIAKEIYDHFKDKSNPPPPSSNSEVLPPSPSSTAIPVTTNYSGMPSVLPGHSPAARNNNPFNIKVPSKSRDGKKTGLQVASEMYGDENIAIGSKAEDGEHFLQFTNPEIGYKAGATLLASSAYSNLSVDAAMRKWSFGGYGAEIVPNIDKNKKINELTPEELNQLTIARMTREDKTVAKAYRNIATLPSQIESSKQSTLPTKFEVEKSSIGPVALAPKKVTEGLIESYMINNKAINDTIIEKQNTIQAFSSINDLPNSISAGLTNININGNSGSLPSPSVTIMTSSPEAAFLNLLLNRIG